MESAISNFQNKELYKLRLVFEQTPGAIFILDREFRFEYVNPGYEKLSGFSKAELLGKSIAEIFSQTEYTEPREAIVRSMKAGEKWEGEMQTYKKDGSTYWATTVSSPFKNESGELDGYIIIQQDVSDRKKIELALRESEKFYRTLIESSMDAVSLNQDGKFLLVNDAFLKTFGYTHDEVFGMNPADFIAPEDRDRVMDLHYKRMHGDIKKMNYTASFLHKSGKRILTELNANTVEVNGRNASFVTMHDITQRTQMESALRESEEKYKTLIENSQDGIFAIANNQILFANKTFCRMIGYTAGELYNKTADSLVHHSDRERGMAISERRSKGDHSTVNDIFRFVAKDGSIKEGDVFSSVLELNGQTVSYITVHDLTEIRRIQNEVAKSERKYRELAEMLPQTVYELDLNANLRYLNKAGREKFGTAYETSNVSVFSIVVPDQLERMKQNFMNVSFRNIPSKGNFYKLRQVNGQVFEAMISATPMIIDGKTVGQRGVVIDISDYVAMQNALADSEEKYRNLIEKATDGIVIVQDGLLKFTNQSMCDIMQYNMEELINKPFLNFIDYSEHESLSNFHKRRMQGEQFSNILRSQFIRKDGKTITVELNARTSNYNGSPAGFIVIRDITERIKIEEELQVAKTELEKLNSQLEKRVKESSKRLTEARTQLINLQKENLQSQYDVLKQQVNPHFLFNSLNVLTSLIKLEPDLAEKFSEQLSKVYRYVLENKDNELVDLNTELNFLDAYIFLLNIRFVGKLTVNLNIPDENRNDRIIPLAMQLLIENAIKHNVMSKSNPLIIDIFIDADNNLNVINNLQERPSQIMSTGVGLKNILNRYKLLNLVIPTFEKTENQFIAKIQLVKSTTTIPAGE